jgi:hypothetical protein
MKNCSVYSATDGSSTFSARTARRGLFALWPFMTCRACHASLLGFEAVQSSRSPQFLRVATMNCGAIEFTVEFQLSIETFPLCGGRSVSVSPGRLSGSGKKYSGADQ